METPEDKFREVRAALAHVGFPDESVARSRICDVLGERGGIPTYLDNHMLGVLSRGTSNRGEADMLKLYCARLIGSEPRILSWEERQSQLQTLGFYTEVDYRGMLYSQGTSAPYEWRGQACFKTVYEIALYPLMLAGSASRSSTIPPSSRSSLRSRSTTSTPPAPSASPSTGGSSW